MYVCVSVCVLCVFLCVYVSACVRVSVHENDCYRHVSKEDHMLGL